MFKRAVIALLSMCLLLFLLPGCATVPAETTTLSTTAPVETTTAPEETTLPPETTVPEETAAPEETFPIDEPLGRDSATPESLMQYPGLAWGCSIEDVIELFWLEEGEYESTLGGFGNRGSLTAANLEFFGVLADELRFTFEDATVIIGLKQNPIIGRRFSPIFSFIEHLSGKYGRCYT